MLGTNIQPQHQVHDQRCADRCGAETARCWWCTRSWWWGGSWSRPPGGVWSGGREVGMDPHMFRAHWFDQFEHTQKNGSQGASETLDMTKIKIMNMFFIVYCSDYLAISLVGQPLTSMYYKPKIDSMRHVKKKFFED